MATAKKATSKKKSAGKKAPARKRAPVRKKAPARKTSARKQIRSVAPAMNNVLVTVDLAHESSWNNALPFAVDQARIHDAKLHVLTVIQDIISGVDWRYAIRGAMHGSEAYDLKSLMTEASERLDAFVRDQVPEDVTTRHIVAHGTIYKEIIETAEKIHADLIVMSSSRPSLRTYLLGPNAARVVRHAECSVAIIRG